ncbi:MAG: hypothetical protein COT25_01465 [Candidatus Kerfeldbacteria bacterium CG08_land_8_20_14_0_20_42_7]|uniref:Uncharacterized protein n=1 Tax=Candidatus Kerfeldbacteria bacterium CG08_land_8_20_14_0_20_42_7 TaxID=2014245 RepID=A0A2H0YVI1_9BACT|nr:MAG: hypothetical protein COT25_01465 [Candidatus Kerfeldbacteria bacterium CG08_land_8_20_14_0_20_42_7]
MPTKKLVSPSELGISLFDFVMLSSKKLLSEEFVLNKIKGVNISRDDLYDIEIVIVYMWLVFHLLNLKGEKYEDAATAMHARFLDTFKIPESNRPQTMDILEKRYEEYKEAFQKKKLNFEGVALAASTHSLKEISKAAFFHFELGARLSSGFKALLNILNEIEVKD